MAIYLNKTPHVISLKFDDMVRIIEPTGPPVRVKTRIGKPVYTENGVTVHAPNRITGLQGLPEPEPDTFIVVSQITALVAARLFPDRTDLVFPATSAYHGADRSERGVMSVSRLIRAS